MRTEYKISNVTKYGYLVVSKHMESISGENIKYKKNVKYYKKGRFSKYQNNFKIYKTIESIEFILSKNRVFLVELGNNVEEEKLCYYTNSIRLLKEIQYDQIYQYLIDKKDMIINGDNYMSKLALIKFGIGLEELQYDESPLVRDMVKTYSKLSYRILFRLKRMGKYRRGLCYILSKKLTSLKKDIKEKFIQIDNKIYYKLFS